MLALYSKSIGYLVAAALTALIASDGQVTPTNVVNVALAVLGAAGVYLLPNLPDGARAYTKSLVAAAIAGLTVLGSALITPGITTVEWLQIGVAILAALHVYIAPNEINEH